MKVDPKTIKPVVEVIIAIIVPCLLALYYPEFWEHTKTKNSFFGQFNCWQMVLLLICLPLTFVVMGVSELSQFILLSIRKWRRKNE